MKSQSLEQRTPHPWVEPLDLQGLPRPGWQRVLGAVEALSDRQRQQRVHEIERTLRANGVGFGRRLPEAGGPVHWSLDLLPQVYESHEWPQLADGIRQRMRLADAMLRDIYGAQTLLTRGVVPARMVFLHPGYTRSLVEAMAPSPLPLLAMDIVRDPAGRWLAERAYAQVIGGMGYTLENRLTLFRVLPNIHRDCNVRRLAPFFQQLQGLLTDQVGHDARSVLLCHGAEHPHYFEHAYLAKYLGLTLVEFSDLSVRENRVYLKSIGGLQRVNLILRMVDDAHLDPIATARSSVAGVPGLLQAALTGNVVVMNPVGAGVLDHPGFDAYLPAICEALLGESLLLPPQETTWFGDGRAEDCIEAFGPGSFIATIDAPLDVFDGDRMDSAAVAALHERLRKDPERFVLVQKALPSVTPIAESGQHAPLRLRTFAVATAERVTVMDGGLGLLDAPVAVSADSAIVVQRCKDAWVLADEPVEPVSLLNRRPGGVLGAPIENELPSRMAENLFWLGRHAERVENLIRVFRTTLTALYSESSSVPSGSRQISVVTTLLRALTVVSGTQPGFVGQGGRRRLRKPDRELHSLIVDAQRVGTLANTINSMQASATRCRERISMDLALILSAMEDQFEAMLALPGLDRISRDADSAYAVLEQFDRFVTLTAAFSGMVQENFTHSDGWRFLMLGRRLDRARLNTAVISEIISADADDPEHLERLLQIFDSVMTYRARYRSQLDARHVLDLLLLDESIPRSVAYQFKQIEKDVNGLPAASHVDTRQPLRRLATTGISRVRLADAGELLKSDPRERQSLRKFLSVVGDIPGKVGTALTAAYFTHTSLPNTLLSSYQVEPGDSSR